MTDNIFVQPVSPQAVSHINLPFEVHLTVVNTPGTDIQRFVSLCQEIGAKPLLIELSRGNHTQQLMLSKLLLSDQLDTVLKTSKDYDCLLSQQAYRTSRLKIELPLQYSEIYRANTSAMPGLYYEWHGKVNLSRNKDLLSLCESHGAHLSRNSLKNEQGMRFITVRELDSKAVFLDRIEALQKDLKDGAWDIVRQQFEYCVFDDNCVLDQGWLSQSLL